MNLFISLFGLLLCGLSCETVKTLEAEKRPLKKIVARAGTNLTLPCDALHEKSISKIDKLTWKSSQTIIVKYIDGKSLDQKNQRRFLNSKNFSLHFHPVQLSDRGDYSCFVNDKSSVEVIDLIIHDVPEPPNRPMITSFTSRSVNLSWSQIQDPKNEQVNDFIIESSGEVKEEPIVSQLRRSSINLQKNETKISSESFNNNDFDDVFKIIDFLTSLVNSEADDLKKISNIFKENPDLVESSEFDEESIEKNKSSMMQLTQQIENLKNVLKKDLNSIVESNCKSLKRFTPELVGLLGMAGAGITFLTTVVGLGTAGVGFLNSVGGLSQTLTSSMNSFMRRNIDENSCLELSNLLQSQNNFIDDENCNKTLNLQFTSELLNVLSQIFTLLSRNVNHITNVEEFADTSTNYVKNMQGVFRRLSQVSSTNYYNRIVTDCQQLKSMAESLLAKYLENDSKIKKEDFEEYIDMNEQSVKRKDDDNEEIVRKLDIYKGIDRRTESIVDERLNDIAMAEERRKKLAIDANSNSLDKIEDTDANIEQKKTVKLMCDTFECPEGSLYCKYTISAILPELMEVMKRIECLNENHQLLDAMETTDENPFEGEFFEDVETRKIVEKILIGESGGWDLLPQIHTNNSITSYQMTRLMPFTIYSFRVRAVNSIGISLPSKESYYIVTLREVPAGKPTITTAHNTSSSSIYLSWKPPEFDTIFGEFLGYRITYHARDVKPEVVNEIFVRDSSVESHEIHELDTYTQYLISIQVFNPEGIGPATNVVVMTDEGADFAMPYNFSHKTYIHVPSDAYEIESNE
ncbi:hypothetical protein PVAND_003519 [Polypedilum vanderplanki]|uniref:Uncharacterized protein n=1 Tax=Polypedilum vanderplanki TaxID=319348 RepID=A0A9J6BUT0_POLVA|nr:hypothetical protein PVAND_003519 [Polypedilum vanderplanki]